MKSAITYFLGAGASAAFGLPITSQIFPKFWKQLWTNRTLRRDQRELLKRVFSVLYGGLTSQSNKEDLPNITEVLSLVDHFINSNQSPLKGLTRNQLIESRLALEMGVVDVIQGYYDYDEEKEQDKLYTSFISLLRKEAKKRKVNIISTNYDILIEYGIFAEEYKHQEKRFLDQVDFGIRWRDPFIKQSTLYHPPKNPKFSIYKLHGSTSWLTCELCNQMYINLYGSVYHQIQYVRPRETNTCHCGHYKLSSVIVAPSTAREVSDANLKYIWNAALESLRTSSEWVMIGYSLPSEDLNIRSILTRAFVGNEKQPKITVVQKSDSTKLRYQHLFGEIAFIKDGLAQYLNQYV
jgi:NAD-dependent SIR2 family protein deacetylase